MPLLCSNVYVCSIRRTVWQRNRHKHKRVAHAAVHRTFIQHRNISYGCAASFLQALDLSAKETLKTKCASFETVTGASEHHQLHHQLHQFGQFSKQSSKSKCEFIIFFMRVFFLFCHIKFKLFKSIIN